MGYVVRVVLVLAGVVIFLFGGTFLRSSEGPYWDAAAPLFVVAALLVLVAAWPLGPREYASWSRSRWVAECSGNLLLRRAKTFAVSAGAIAPSKAELAERRSDPGEPNTSDRVKPEDRRQDGA